MQFHIVINYLITLEKKMPAATRPRKEYNKDMMLQQSANTSGGINMSNMVPYDQNSIHNNRSLQVGYYSLNNSIGMQINISLAIENKELADDDSPKLERFSSEEEPTD